MTGPELSIPLDASSCRTLEETKELTLRTGFSEIGAGHIALALLCRTGGWLDGLLQRRFGGLRAGTVAESLRDILELAADRLETAPGEAPSQEMAADARAVLARAAEVAVSCGCREVTCQSLARALFEQPSPSLVEAFQDAGVGASEIESLAGQISVIEEAASGVAPTIFRDGAVDLALLGPTARQAVARMAQRAVAQPDIQLTDFDLLACLLAEEGSRLGEALHVMGLSPSAVRRNLIRSLPLEVVAHGGPLAEGRLSKLLRRVFLEAAALAASEHYPLISESHLVRAHLDRVGGGAGNVYQRLNIDATRLRAFLARSREDREPASSGLTGTEAAADDIESSLRSAVINQDHAIARVAPSLKRMQAGLAEPGRLGYQEAIEELHLWEKDFGDGTLPQEVQDLVWSRVEEYFSPEFRGRFGRENVIFFRHFGRANYRTLVSLQVRRLVEEMAEKGLAVEVPPEAESLLAGFAWQERQDGARQVRRLVNQHLRTQMAEAILADRSRTRFAFDALEGRGEIVLQPEGKP
jgi:ATP-dependent Clp protease ATP-binding subunit ClpA